MSTELLLVLDRSGSMENLRSRTISDVNELIGKYRETPDTYMSLVQFDHEYEPNYIHKASSEVQLLTPETYAPRGSTALYDAICRTIDEAGVYFKSMPENQRQNLKVVLAVFTDGYENASKQFKSEDVKKRLEHQKNTYGWEFVFMGANEQAVIGAQKDLGFAAINTIKMSDNAAGRGATIRNFAGKMSAYALTGDKDNMAWNATDRAEAQQ